MLAAVLGATLLGSVAAASPCAAAGGLESGICQELRQSAPSGLELLQHGQHSVGKAEHSRDRHLTMERATKPGDMLKAAAEEMEQQAATKLISKMANHVIRSDPAWEIGERELAAKALARVRELMIGRAEHGRNATVSSKGAEEWSDAWHRAKEDALERGTKGISAALRLPEVYLDIQERFNPTPRLAAVKSAQQAKQDALAAQPELNFVAQAITRGAGPNAVEFEWAKRVMMLTNFKAEKDVDWQRAMDNLGQKALESLAANALLATATDVMHQAPEGIGPLAEKVQLLADQKDGADKAWQLAKEEAKEKAIDKVSADLAFETFGWIQKQIPAAGNQTVQLARK